MYKDHSESFERFKVFLFRLRLHCNRVFTILILFLLLVVYILYEVQYKTGIELLSFVPIDDSGFEVYNEDLFSSVYTSRAAANQPKKGSILCWVMTTASHHNSRVPAVNSTWLPRCDSSHFLTNNDRFLDSSIPFHTLFEKLPESYYKLFWKTRLALYYVYTSISMDFDWYFKADDDTYLVVENLRKYLSTLDPSEPHYIGFRLKRRAPEHGYNAGGSGYVMSRAAMKLFAEKLFHDHERCPYHEWEDYAIARCLSGVGVYARDSRDERGRQRFLPWRPEEHFDADLTRSFLMDDIEYKGASVFHRNLIAMHHLGPAEIHLIDGMLYGVAPGIHEKY